MHSKILAFSKTLLKHIILYFICALYCAVYSFLVEQGDELLACLHNNDDLGNEDENKKLWDLRFTNYKMASSNRKIHFTE